MGWSLAAATLPVPWVARTVRALCTVCAVRASTSNARSGETGSLYSFLHVMQMLRNNWHLLHMYLCIYCTVYIHTTYEDVTAPYCWGLIVTHHTSSHCTERSQIAPFALYILSYCSPRDNCSTDNNARDWHVWYIISQVGLRISQCWRLSQL